MATNIYRDGQWLVVPLEDAHFPARCVKTNESVSSPDYIYESDLLRAHVKVSSSGRAVEDVLVLLFGNAGGAISDIAFKRRLRYRIGLADRLQATAIRRWRVGLGLVIAGPILAFVMAMAVVTITENRYGTPSLPMTIAAGSVGIVLLVVGIMLFGLSSKGVLGVARSDGRYVWLTGAHPDFLASLPESPEKWVPPKLFG